MACPDLRVKPMQQVSYTQTKRAPAPVDPRWQALDAVQAVMGVLHLRDRDIAVLRGLLTFVSADRWDGGLTVFASNRVLQDRCGGMDERTLRRRLARLCEVGLITRHLSPNRKRYVVRDETGAEVLTYGFDLAPLRDGLAQLQDMARHQRAAQDRVTCLRALLRDALYHLGLTDRAAGAEPFRPLLRRKTTAEVLEAALEQVQALLGLCKTRDGASAKPIQLTDSDGRTDRDIQTSHKEYFEKKEPQKKETPMQMHDGDLTVALCLMAAPNAAAFSPERPETWPDISTLAQTLAPAIGITVAQLQRTKTALGERGASLAILGLVEAYPRIREPQRYLNTLVSRAMTKRVDVVRMFRSLTGWSRFPAGNQAALT